MIELCLLLYFLHIMKIDWKRGSRQMCCTAAIFCIAPRNSVEMLEAMSYDSLAMLTLSSSI